MPVYNGGRWLRQTLDALLGQTYRDLELVISDNASTDDSAAICREYAARDPRVVYHRNEVNVGASDNYNTVFRRSSGRYFKWASCNDLCMPTFLERCVEVLEARPDAVLAYPRTRLFAGDVAGGEDYDDGLDLQEADPYRRFRRLVTSMRLNNVMNGLIRTSALRRTPLIKVFFASDVNLMAELALHGKFVEIPEYLFYRRMDPEAATRLKSQKEVLRHYDPSLKRRMQFQNWKIDWEYFRAVARTTLPLGTKLRLYGFLGRVVLWDRGKLADDVRIAACSLRSRWFGQQAL